MSFPELIPPWTKLPLIHETTGRFPEPTMDVLSATIASEVEGLVPGEVSDALTNDPLVIGAVNDAITDADIPGEVAIALAAQAGKIVQGTGFPNGSVTADPGTLYVDTARTNGAEVWFKRSGTGNTGWYCIIGDTGWRNVGTLMGADFTVDGGSTFGAWLRRVGDTVTFEFRGKYVSGQGFILAIPSGFASARWVARGAATRINTPYGVFGVRHRTNLAALDVVGSLTADDELSATVMLSTTEAWPSTLPGTPA